MLLGPARSERQDRFVDDREDHRAVVVDEFAIDDDEGIAAPSARLDTSDRDLTGHRDAGTEGTSEADLQRTTRTSGEAGPEGLDGEPLVQGQRVECAGDHAPQTGVGRGGRVGVDEDRIPFPRVLDDLPLGERAAGEAERPTRHEVIREERRHAAQCRVAGAGER